MNNFLNIDNSPWQGAVLTGVNGSKNLEVFTKMVDDNDLEIYNNFFGENNTDFHPKMSHVKNFSVLRSINKSQDVIISKSSDLELRSVSFSKGDSRNIQNIYANASNEQIVMSGVDCDFERTIELAKFSLKYLTELNKTWATRLEKLVVEVIPQSSSDESKPLRKNGSGLSTHYYRKGILVGCPAEGAFAQFEFLLNFAHELGHQALITYQKHDKIVLKPHDTPIFSIIRNTERPLIQSIHAMVAVMYMLISNPVKIVEIGEPSFVRERFRGLIDNLKDAIFIFKDIPFTKLGSQIYREGAALVIKSEMIYEKF